MTPKEISTERHRLEKARRDYMTRAMEEFDKEYYVQLKLLRDKCSEHNFKFSDFGLLGHPWYYCTICGKTKVGDLD